MPADADSRTLDVTAFLENAGITRFHVWLLVFPVRDVFRWARLLADLVHAAVLARRTAGLTTAMMGYVTAAAFLGQMIGSLCRLVSCRCRTAAGR